MTCDVVKQHVARCLQRGNAGGYVTDRFSTSTAYWPKQADFLNWISSRSDLHSGFRELQNLSGASSKELETFTWSRKDDVHLLVTERSALQYLEWKLEQHDLPSKGIGKVIDLDRLPDEEISHDNAAKPSSRRPRERRPHMSIPNFRSHKSALCELQKFQFDVLHLSFVKRLADSSVFGNFLASTIARIKDNEKINNIDKGRDTLKSNPSTEEISKMMGNWWEKGTKNLKDAHLALLNQCIWMDSCTTLLRFDSEYRTMYSDKEYLKSTELMRENMCSVQMELFLSRANQSKQNQNGAQTYTEKVPSYSPLECGIVCESAMLTVRHDLMMVHIPQFSLAYESVHEGRPWYLDCFHCQVKQSKKAKPSEIEEEEDDFDRNVVQQQEISSSLKIPYSISSARKAFEKMFEKVGLDPKHVLHLGRVWGTLRNGMEGPFWALISPPPSFVAMVLTRFRDAKPRALDRKKKARMTTSKERRIQLTDEQCLNTIEYGEQLSVKLVQALPFILEKYPTHVLSRHPVCRAPHFDKWCCFVRHVVTILQGVNASIAPIFNQVNGLKFKSDIEESVPTLSHCVIDGAGKTILDYLCERIVEKSLQGCEGNGKGDSAAERVINTLVYSDMKSDIMLLRRSIEDLGTTLVGQVASHGEDDLRIKHLQMPEPLSRMKKNKEVKTRGVRAMSSTREIEVPSLPLLSTIHQQPISVVWNIWSKGYEYAPNERTRPLKEAITKPRSGFLVFGEKKKSKSVAMTAMRMRHICTALELVTIDGIDGVEWLEKKFSTSRRTLNSLGDFFGGYFKLIMNGNGNKMTTSVAASYKGAQDLKLQCQLFLDNQPHSQFKRKQSE